MNSTVQSEGVDFTKPWPLGDLVLIVEGRMLYGSRAVLAMCSPHFRHILSHPCHQGKTEISLELSGKKYEDVHQLVRVTHPPPAALTEYNVDQVLPLAREYCMEQMVASCEYLLLQRPVSPVLLLTAECYNLQALQRHCISQISDDLASHFTNNGVGQLAQEMDKLGLSDHSKYLLMGAHARQCERDMLTYRQRAEQGGAGLKYTALQAEHDSGRLEQQTEKLQLYEGGIKKVWDMIGHGQICVVRDTSGQHMLGMNTNRCQVCKAYNVLQGMVQVMSPQQPAPHTSKDGKHQEGSCSIS